MCGIVGYIGNKDVKSVVLGGLYNLEYRGYDSAGVAFIDKKEKLQVYKAVGKVSVLDNEVLKNVTNINFKLGIGHTRWATHGKVSEQNAHPHTSASGKIAIVHNGIIENYRELKEFLDKKGYKLVSETDTEVIVQLIEYFYTAEQLNLITALTKALKLVKGTYAIALISEYDPNKIFVARKGSPLTIGLGKGEMFVGSDIYAFIKYTNLVIYLNDENIGIIDGLAYNIYDLEGNTIDIRPVVTDSDLMFSDLQGYRSYMEKEIFEQPLYLKNALEKSIIIDNDDIIFPYFNFFSQENIKKINRIIITACGSSWNAGLIGKYLIEKLAQIPTSVEYASEFRYSSPIIHQNDMIIAISQSGETADTLEAIKIPKSHGAKILSITNIPKSSICRESDGVIYMNANQEIGVAATKTFTNTLLILVLLSLYLAHAKKLLSNPEIRKMHHELNSIPNKVQHILDKNEYIFALANKYVHTANLLYVARGINYPVALEGALKLKEISYIHAEGYAAGEMKHGPLALIDEFMPVIFVAPKDYLYEKAVSNINEVKSRHGKIIGIISESDEYLPTILDDYICIPNTFDEFNPILSVIPLQLFAYYVGSLKGLNVDKPRNLAKSVTVE